MLLKIKCSIKELNVFHKFNQTYIILWSNQFKNTYKLSKINKTLSLKTYINTEHPFALICGVYGESEKNTHNIGCFVLDASKLKSGHVYNIESDIKDHTSKPSITGKSKIDISIMYDFPMKEIDWNNRNSMDMVHASAEKNLTWIEPYSSIGYPPINPALYKIHSPYYTTNIGVTLPSGAFCIKKTHYNEDSYKKSLVSTYSRFKVALNLCDGTSNEEFLKYCKTIFNKDKMLDPRNKWIYDRIIILKEF